MHTAPETVETRAASERAEHNHVVLTSSSESDVLNAFTTHWLTICRGAGSCCWAELSQTTTQIPWVGLYVFCQQCTLWLTLTTSNAIMGNYLLTDFSKGKSVAATCPLLPPGVAFDRVGDEWVFNILTCADKPSISFVTLHCRWPIGKPDSRDGQYFYYLLYDSIHRSNVWCYSHVLNIFLLIAKVYGLLSPIHKMIYINVYIITQIAVI